METLCMLVVQFITQVISGINAPKDATNVVSYCEEIYTFYLGERKNNFYATIQQRGIERNGNSVYASKKELIIVSNKNFVYFKVKIIPIWNTRGFSDFGLRQ